MKIISFAIYDLKKLFRDKGSLIFLIIMPIIMTFIMGMVTGGDNSNGDSKKIPIGLVNYDNNGKTNELIDLVKKDNTITVWEMIEAELVDKVKSAELEMGLIIPEGFGEGIGTGKAPEIKVIKLPSAADYIAIEGIINSAFSKISVKQNTLASFREKYISMDKKSSDAILAQIELKLDENLQKPSVVTVNVERMSSDKQVKSYNGKAVASIGIIVMFVMFTLIRGAGEILEEKKNKTWDRLTTTPTRIPTIILGKILGTFLKGWTQVSILIVFGMLVMGVSWGNSIFATIIVISVFLLSVTSFGMFLSTFVKSNSQLGAISAIFIISTSMLSGCYFPIWLMPETMQKIATFFPQYWAVKGLNNTVVLNLGIGEVVQPILILVGISILFFGLSVVKGSFRINIKREIKQP